MTDGTRVNSGPPPLDFGGANVFILKRMSPSFQFSLRFYKRWLKQKTKNKKHSKHWGTFLRKYISWANKILRSLLHIWSRFSCMTAKGCASKANTKQFKKLALKANSLHTPLKCLQKTSETVTLSSPISKWVSVFHTPFTWAMQTLYLHVNPAIKGWSANFKKMRTVTEGGVL